MYGSTNYPSSRSCMSLHSNHGRFYTLNLTSLFLAWSVNRCDLSLNTIVSIVYSIQSAKRALPGRLGPGTTLVCEASTWLCELFAACPSRPFLLPSHHVLSCGWHHDRRDKRQVPTVNVLFLSYYFMWSLWSGSIQLIDGKSVLTVSPVYFTIVGSYGRFDSLFPMSVSDLYITTVGFLSPSIRYSPMPFAFSVGPVPAFGPYTCHLRNTTGYGCTLYVGRSYMHEPASHRLRYGHFLLPLQRWLLLSSHLFAIVILWSDDLRSCRGKYERTYHICRHTIPNEY